MMRPGVGRIRPHGEERSAVTARPNRKRNTMDSEETERVEHDIAEKRHDVDETRSHLVEKLESFEHQVEDIVHGASESVSDAVATAKEAVDDTIVAMQGAVRGTVSSVKHVLDFPGHARRHPWLPLFCAAGLGFACGRLVSRHR